MVTKCDGLHILVSVSSNLAFEFIICICGENTGEMELRKGLLI